MQGIQSSPTVELQALHAPFDHHLQLQKLLAEYSSLFVESTALPPNIERWNQTCGSTVLLLSTRPERGN